MGDKINYFVFAVFIRLFSLLAFRLIYFFSDVLFILLYKVFKYRRATVFHNLEHSFPSAAPATLQKAGRNFYHHLCDLILESIKGLSLSKDALNSRCRLVNIAELNTLAHNGESIIMIASHYNNWEWTALAISLHSHHEVVGIYKPLSNTLIDQELYKLRSRWGLHLRTMQQAGRALVEFQDRPAMFCLIADQSPSNTMHAHWLRFLHQETAFLSGPDKIARKTGYKVFYSHIHRIARGVYEVHFIPVHAAPRHAPEGEITCRFADRLEEIIKASPSNWLWSHRRWKKKRPVDVALLQRRSSTGEMKEMDKK